MLEAHLRKVQLSCETIQPQRMEDLCQRRPTGDSAAPLKLPLGSNSGLSDHMSGQHIHLRDSQIVRQHPSIDRSCFVYSQRAYLCFSGRNMLKSRCSCLIPVPLEKMRDHFLRAVFCKGSSPCCRFPPCYAMFIIEDALAYHFLNHKNRFHELATTKESTFLFGSWCKCLPHAQQNLEFRRLLWPQHLLAYSTLLLKLADVATCVSRGFDQKVFFCKPWANEALYQQRQMSAAVL